MMLDSVNNFMSWLRNLVHHLIPVVGMVMLIQAPITNQLVSSNVDTRWANYAFGALGAIAAVASKWVDSKSYTTIQAALSNPSTVLSAIGETVAPLPVTSVDPHPAVTNPSTSPATSNASVPSVTVNNIIPNPSTVVRPTTPTFAEQNVSAQPTPTPDQGATPTTP